MAGVLRSVGRGLVQIKRATNEVRTTVQDEMDQIERDIDLKDVREAADDLKKDFYGVKSGMDPLEMNRVSTGEQLEAVADVMDQKEKEDNANKLLKAQLKQQHKQDHEALDKVEQEKETIRLKLAATQSKVTIRTVDCHL